MRIGIKILNFVLATILLTSAALHQEKADVFEFDLVLGVQSEEVGPGDYIECSPVVTNIGNIPGNVYLKIIQPMVQEEGTPLYVFEINDKWMKKEELVLGDEVVITYMYSEPLKPIESTIPLCDGAQMAQISIPHYAKIEDINFTINMYVHKLREKGVEVKFEREGISSFDAQADMVFNFLVAVAQEESKSISQNTRWANEKLAKQGIRHLGNNRVLGYDEVNGVLTPNKDAWVVKYIFEEYAAGKSMLQICDGLEKKGFVTMTGNTKMRPSTISSILHNELYKGDQRIQKKPPKDLLSKKPDYSKEYTSYYVEDNHEAIVSRELWDKVQEILTVPKTSYIRNDSHPLKDKIVCGECGMPFKRVTRRGHKTWVCKGRHSGSGCRCAILKEELIEEKIGEEGCKKVTVYEDGRMEIEK